ncbi:hypothetical protein [Chitinimonas koreensis]|uniref:hypothetical protein n=1 Tax=Chitinimonas koreensis TaxID=356302 RepID=UPI00049036F3|nr:hypothetical protein [Chitinimonas koreensis]QNM95497.1 hypothetical protein H9L41_16720 [Chitinimonas koreensis]
MDQLLEIEVARLDGYIHGITELSGKIREHLGAAYLISRDDKNKNVTDLLIEHYAQQTQLEFSSVNELPGGLGELEAELCDYLAVDVLGIAAGLSDEAILDRKKYLSFRVMDMLRIIRDHLGSCAGILKLERYNITYKTQCVYFGLLFDSALLVLQFNKMSYDD